MLEAATIALVSLAACGGGQTRAALPEPRPIVRRAGDAPLDASPDVPASVTPRLQVEIGASRICVARDGHVFCRGVHAHGDLLDSQDVFLPVRGIDDATGVAVGWSATCVIRRDGSVWCWGEIGGTRGEEPRAIDGLAAVTALAISRSEACALHGDGRVSCWGADGTWTARPLASVPRAVGLTAGSHHLCARTRDGQVWCWGDNRDGALPGTPRGSRAEPMEIAGAGGAIAIDAGSSTTCVLRGTGEIYCWNAEGQTAPAAVVPGGIAIGVGQDHACVLRREGTVRCVGSARSGQLGDGRSRAPIGSEGDAAGVAGARALTAGSHSACAYDPGAGIEVVRCWGAQPDSRGYPGYRPAPVPLGGVPGGLPRSERVPRAIDPAQLAGAAAPTADLIRVRGRLSDAVQLVVAARRAHVILLDDTTAELDATLGPGDARTALEALARMAGLELRTWGRGPSAIHVIGSAARIARAEALPARALPGTRRVDLRFADASASDLLRLLQEVARWQLAGEPAGRVGIWVQALPVGVVAAALLRLAGADVVVRGTSVTVTGGAFSAGETTEREQGCQGTGDRFVRLPCVPSWRLGLAGVAAERGRWHALLRGDGDADVVRSGEHVGTSEVLPELVSDVLVTTQWRVHSISDAEVVITHDAPAGPQRARRLVLGEAPIGPDRLGPF